LDANAEVEKAPPLARAAAEWAIARHVRVGRRRIRYRAAGEGPPLVLVHGLSMSADYWVRNAAPIAAGGYRVLAADLPGFGMTEGPTEGLSVSRQAASIHRWIEAMDLDPAVFAGHSISCQTVLELAAARPECVRGLVLVAPTGDRKRGLLLRQAWGLIRDAWREPPTLLALATQAYLRAGPHRFLRTWRLGARHDPIALLSRISAPTLVLLGTADPVVEFAFAQQIADGIPGGRITMIDGGTHGLILSKPQEVNAAILEFLGAIEQHRHAGGGRDPG
jgi:2-hydroxy-6-oxonona-2,4-dienedioate hydrolase